MSSKKFYVVWCGSKTGIFSDWKNCEQAIKDIQLRFTSRSTTKRLQNTLTKTDRGATSGKR